MCVKKIDKELVGVALGAQIGKSSSRVLEAPRHEINTCIKRIDKKLIGLGQGAQVGKLGPGH